MASRPAGPNFGAWGARRPEGDRRGVRELIAEVRREVEHRLGASSEERIVQLFDAEAIAGRLHLASALGRARRARARGTAVLSDPGAELVLFVAGSDQLPEALRRVGIGPSTREIVLVSAPTLPLEEAASALRAAGLEPVPGIYPRPPARATLVRLGIDPRAAELLPPERWEALVVEAGAMVELARSAAARRKG